MICVVGLVILWVECVKANSAPQLEFTWEVKTPQLIGIVTGCVVFTVTISTVLYLLWKSGSWKRFVEEVQSGEPLVIKTGAMQVAPTVLRERPKLYDHLVEASMTLPVVMDDMQLETNRLIVRTLKFPEAVSKSTPTRGRKAAAGEGVDDVSELFLAGSGVALYHECAYDPVQLWAWHSESKVLPNPDVPSTGEGAQGTFTESGEFVPPPDRDLAEYPVSSREAFEAYLRAASEGNRHGDPPRALLCVVDKEFGRPVGMLEIADNSPRNLTARIDNLWLTPAFQRKKFAHEAMLVVLTHLFGKLNYRRITCEVDSRHEVARKFLLRCGFVLECILHKHRIVQERNRDSCVYVVLNSDWQSVERKLRAYCGIDVPKPKVHNIAEIDTIEEFVEGLEASQVAASVESIGGEESQPKKDAGDSKRKTTTPRQKSSQNNGKARLRKRSSAQ